MVYTVEVQQERSRDGFQGVKKKENKRSKELTDVRAMWRTTAVSSIFGGGGGGRVGGLGGKGGRGVWRLTVNGDPDLGVVVAVGDLPNIKGLRGGVREQAEDQDDGVGRGKTLWMNLPGKEVKNTRVCHEAQGRGNPLEGDVTSLPLSTKRNKCIGFPVRPSNVWLPSFHPRLIFPGSPLE